MGYGGTRTWIRYDFFPPNYSTYEIFFSIKNISNPPSLSLSTAFILADCGYDVWLGNVRGNRYSRNHTIINPSGERSERKQFWSFSWHEIGMIDLPTMIDYILDTTEFEQLHYVGHSQGTTAFFVMASERPEYNDKVIMMHALAPIAFMGNIKGTLAKTMATVLSNTEVQVVYILPVKFG